MEHISISKYTFDTIVENIETLQKVLNKVDYEKDHHDPKNIEYAPAYAIGYSRSTLDEILTNLNIIKETNS